MNAGRTGAVAVRILRQIIRDRRAVALFLIGPLVVMTLLAVLLRSEQRPPRVAIDARGSMALFVGELERMLDEPGEDDVALELRMVPEGMSAREAVERGELDAVLVFPETFLEERAEGQRSGTELIVEGADPMRTAEIFSRFRKALPDSMGGLPLFLPDDCDSHCADTIADGPPEMELVKVYGQELDEQMDFFTPVLPPFFAFFFVFLISGMTFLRERTSGTAERILSSPLTRSELVAGYVLGFLPVAIVQGGVVIAFAYWALGGPWGGMAVVITVLLLSVVAECIGVLVSAFARSEFQVMQFIPVIILPQFLLCGLIWPVDQMPGWLQVVAHAFPLTYAVTAIRNVAIRGMSLGEISFELTVIVGFCVAGILLAAASIRRRV
ncbi:MAG: ABC transporter permease [Deltaproteobacteria bacterium]|nr:ABC transporter permease [Deltaproteobacteria bacterium]